MLPELPRYPPCGLSILILDQQIRTAPHWHRHAELLRGCAQLCPRQGFPKTITSTHRMHSRTPLMLLRSTTHSNINESIGDDLACLTQTPLYNTTKATLYGANAPAGGLFLDNLNGLQPNIPATKSSLRCSLAWGFALMQAAALFLWLSCSTIDFHS